MRCGGERPSWLLRQSGCWSREPEKAWYCAEDEDPEGQVRVCQECSWSPEENSVEQSWEARWY